MNLEQFPGVNAGYVLELYEKYRQDPDSVDQATRDAFANWTPVEASSAAAPAGSQPAAVNIQQIVGAANLAESIRRYGHLAARHRPAWLHADW